MNKTHFSFVTIKRAQIRRQWAESFEKGERWFWNPRFTTEFSVAEDEEERRK
jgi:hypothetical protein